MRRPVILVILVLLALAATPFILNRPAEHPYQGWIEADTLFIGAETAGRLTGLAVREGESVPAGAALFSLDDRNENAAVENARALLARAGTQLALTQAAQKRPEEIAVLRASEREAEAKLALATQDLERTQQLFDKGTAPRSTLDTSVSNRNASAAALDNIRRQIDLGGLPERSELIATAEQSVSAAKADLASAEAALARRSVSAAVAGTVQEIYYRIGEVVPAGRPVIALLPPENKRVRFFVPQDKLPGIALGGLLRVNCDGCAPATARVSFISGSAEYTPPEIFSPEERAKLVFRIEAVPDTPAALRVGQPVEVFLTTQEPGS